MYFVMDSRILPKVRLADYFILKPPCAHKKRVPHEYIAYLVEKGELYLMEEGITYHLRPGDFILLNPESYHEGKLITYCEYYYIHFHHEALRLAEDGESAMHEQMMEIRRDALRSDSCEEQSKISQGLIIPKYCHIQDETLLASLTRQLLSVVTANFDHMEYYKALSGIQFLSFLIELSRSCLSLQLQESKMTTARGYKKVLEVQSFLHECYREPVSGDSLAEKFDMNFDYLNRLFRKNIGKPVFQYLRDIRIAKAKELLTTTSMRIVEVSDCVGFTDESYFSKVFKKQTGISPADYARTEAKAEGNPHSQLPR
ncbi:MAG: AraC family transcriptional regulator [Eubacteriales bacterium]|nr:AraC family transcriptional regulator [Eubacteriales bacterium]